MLVLAKENVVLKCLFRLLSFYVQAGFDCGERMWRMPFYKHYTEQIESDVADIRNTGKKR